MARKKFKRETRPTKLTTAEVARDKELRRKIMAEFPPLESKQPAPGSLRNALRRAIESNPKSVYQICKDAGISQIVVSRFLSGERDIRLATADRLAKVLGIAVGAK